MSMNLHCNQLDLWQTPTFVTYMCTMQPEGHVGNDLTGDDAKRALHMYIQWAKDQNVKVTRTAEDAEFAKDRRAVIDRHICEVLEVLDSPALKVWWM